MKLWMKILIALLLGLIAGLILGPYAIYLKPVGTIFLNMINMIIVLLVLSSITVGITNIHDPKKLGRVGLKAMFLYLATMLIAIGIGLLVASIVLPGQGLNLTIPETYAIAPPTTTSISDILISIIPKNPISAMVEGNFVQLIVFALFLGISINLSGEKGRPLLECMESLADAMYRMTSIVMEFSPIGVFAIMAWVAGSFGVSVLMPLLKFLFAYYLAGAIQALVVYCGMIKFMAKLSPWPFFRGMGDAIVMAFSTCSSSATLPVAMHCVQNNLGMSKNIANFMLPLGTTINMNGAAIFQAMSALFIAQAYEINLSWPTILTIVLTATLSAIGAAGIPGTGFIMLSAVITSAGLPLEGLALLAGIDRIREMGSTVLNVLGDTVCALVVAKQEGELDIRQYYYKEQVEAKDDIAL